MLLFFNASDSVWCLCAGYMSIDKIHELVFPLFSFYYSVDINGFTLWLSQHCNNEQYREVEINLILLSAAINVQKKKKTKTVCGSMCCNLMTHPLIY